MNLSTGITALSSLLLLAGSTLTRIDASKTNALGLNFCPVGHDIDADAKDEWFGSALSISSDGKRVAIGAPHKDASHTKGSGLARVYKWDGFRWNQFGSDIHGEKFSQSGNVVSISGDGNMLAVGAKKGNGYGIGWTRMYRWEGEDWQQLGDKIDGPEYYSHFGSAVSLAFDGKTVAIGAPGTNDHGRTQIWEWDGNSWEQLGGDINGEGSNKGGYVDTDKSGSSVSISDDGRRVAIGAPHNDGKNGKDSGHTRVYQWNGNKWTKMGQDIDGESALDEAGVSVSLSGDGRRVAIGAPKNVGGGKPGDLYWGGHTRVYEWDGTSWGKRGPDIDSNEDDGAGSSVSLSYTGARLAIGAPYSDIITKNGGSAQIREWDGSAWRQIGPDIHGDGYYDFWDMQYQFLVTEEELPSEPPQSI